MEKIGIDLDSDEGEEGAKLQQPPERTLVAHYSPTWLPPILASLS